MNNVVKHAAATSVSVSVERRGNHVIAIVEDNGQGFDRAVLENVSEQRRIGIAGMRERASIVDGELTIESSPGQGTTVRIKVPVPAS
jgi:signal transduction histidine kinase